MDKHVGMYLKKINGKLEQRVNELWKESDLTSTQIKVLFFLHKNADKKITFCDVAKFLDCSAATVSGLISRLEEKGRVVVEKDEADRRIKHIRATDVEKEKFRCEKHREETENMLLKGFSSEEKEQVLSLLERMYENVKNGMDLS